MKLNVTFRETDQHFQPNFGEVFNVSDGGFERGYDKGYAEGETAGYTKGYGEGETAGYNQGNSDGYETGYTKGNSDGYANGYETGYADGKGEVFYSPYSGAMYYKVMNVTEPFSWLPGGAYRNSAYLEEYYAHNAVLYNPNMVGQECFAGCYNLRKVYLPKATYYMHYNFSDCVRMKEAQLGSVGYPVTNMAVYTFRNCTQSDLTITVYVNAEKLADIPNAVKSVAPWGATNATIIYRSATTGEVIEL